MTTDLAIVLAFLAAAIVMFALNRPRMDVVALLMIAGLPLSGVISLNEALAGFADPNVILIAALFVLGEGLVRTGIAQRLGDLLIRQAGHSETRLIVLLMIMVATIGSVMSSTGVVAIFIPIVLRIARAERLPAAHLMMPLSVAGLCSGMMTLVGTPPNLVIQGELVRRGLEGFGFFSFTPFGIPLLAIAIVHMLLARRLLPNGAAHGASRPGLANWIAEYGLASREFRLRIGPGSPLAGKRLDELDLRGSAGVNIIGIERPAAFSRILVRPLAATRLQRGDVLFLDVVSPGMDMDTFRRDRRLEALPLSGAYFSDHSQEIGMAEVMIPPTSHLVGNTVVEARFRSQYDLAVVGLKRGRTAETGRLTDMPLKAGDMLLVAGPWRSIARLRGDLGDMGDLVVVNLPAEFDDVAPAASRAFHALGALALTIILMVSGLVPNVVAALIGCLVMGFFGCIDMNRAYRAIHWQSLILIVGMLPFSLALQKTGGLDAMASTLLELSGGGGLRLMLAALFVMTAALGLFISNTATAVLMAPVALVLADSAGASPYPFAMTVALAASASFMTPVSSPVNTLVAGPGNYTFGHFLRIGLPLALLMMAVSVALVPILLPP